MADECGADFEVVAFFKHFSGLPDHRQAGKVTYPLDEMLLLCLLAVLAGADTFVDVAHFGAKKVDLLRRFGVKSRRASAARFIMVLNRGGQWARAGEFAT